MIGESRSHKTMHGGRRKAASSIFRGRRKAISSTSRGRKARLAFRLENRGFRDSLATPSRLPRVSLATPSRLPRVSLASPSRLTRVSLASHSRLSRVNRSVARRPKCRTGVDPFRSEDFLRRAPLGNGHRSPGASRGPCVHAPQTHGFRATSRAKVVRYHRRDRRQNRPRVSSQSAARSAPPETLRRAPWHT